MDQPQCACKCFCMLWLLQKAQHETHQSASDRQFQVSQTNGIFSADCIRFAFAITKEKNQQFLRT